MLIVYIENLNHIYIWHSASVSVDWINRRMNEWKLFKKEDIDVLAFISCEAAIFYKS